MNLTAAGN